MTDFNRVDQILKHPEFQRCLEENSKAEADRRFCRHNIEHFLDVARIACIINLEENFGVEKEYIYSASLLHDIGKHLQYEKGIPHEKAGVDIAPGILRDCGYGEEEIRYIVEAILSHRDSDVREQKNLNGLLYRGDKASRCCFACKVQSECNWSDEKKNLKVRY